MIMRLSLLLFIYLFILLRVMERWKESLYSPYKEMLGGLDRHNIPRWPRPAKDLWSCVNLTWITWTCVCRECVCVHLHWFVSWEVHSSSKACRPSCQTGHVRGVLHKWFLSCQRGYLRSQSCFYPITPTPPNHCPPTLPLPLCLL